MASALLTGRDKRREGWVQTGDDWSPMQPAFTGLGDSGTENRRPGFAMPPAPPKAPRLAGAQGAADEERRRRANTGRASTILTGFLEEEVIPATRLFLGAGY